MIYLKYCCLDGLIVSTPGPEAVMTNVFNNVKQINSKKVDQDDDNFEIPLDITDILDVCRSYSVLGWNIQNQIESIMETGIQESIKSGKLKISSLPLIKNFLKTVSANPLFGEAQWQCQECVSIIENYELTHPQLKAVSN